MYLKHYMNEKGDRVYTLKVMNTLLFNFKIMAKAMYLTIILLFK